MFEVKWLLDAESQYNDIRNRAIEGNQARKKKGQTKSTKAEGLFKQVHKTVQLLKDNPRHPGLKTHEYDAIPHPYDPKQKVFEAYAQNKTPGAYRVFWCYGPGTREITIIAITPHP